MPTVVLRLILFVRRSLESAACPLHFRRTITFRTRKSCGSLRRHAANYERIKTRAGRLSMLASYAAIGTCGLQIRPLAAARPPHRAEAKSAARLRRRALQEARSWARILWEMRTRRIS